MYNYDASTKRPLEEILNKIFGQSASKAAAPQRLKVF
jgi:hypothetical protein